MSERSIAVSDAELDALFADFLPHDRLLLAVSGGRDSMALLALAARWRRAGVKFGQDRPDLHVLTIDHGLRAEAACEAGLVASYCATIGVPHAVQRIQHAAPDSGLQSWARDVRYAALANSARDLGCSAIATGHQAEDQAETVLMRLARGSGIDGLAAMSSGRGRKPYALNGICLLRPLLSIERRRLSATLQALNVPWADDPSNVDDRFERSRYAVHAAELQALGLKPAPIGLSARRLEDARAALEWAVERSFETMPECSEALATAAYGTLPRDRFDRLPVEIRRRLLSRVLSAVRGVSGMFRLERLEALVERIERMSTDQLAETLGGCIVEVTQDQIAVFREPGRDSIPTLNVEPGTSNCWDHRFQVYAPEDLLHPVQVRAFGDPPNGGKIGLPQSALKQLPARARATVPTFWLDTVLLAVPQIGYAAAGFSAEMPRSGQTVVADPTGTKAAGGAFSAQSVTALER